MEYDPSVWGPTYWFFLDNIAFNYPSYPNDVIKKKYYDFIQNLPIFIPHYKISNEFQDLLNLYPVKPYLDNKKSFIQWVHFIHNKINLKLEKPQTDIKKYYIDYYNKYEKKTINKQIKNLKKYIAFITIISILIFMIIFYYNK
jgi:hypothetical protein